MKRRKFLGASALAAALPTRIFAQTATSRPQLLQSVQSGDVASDGAVVWSRADRPARMMVEYATTEGFSDPRRIVGPLALEATDFTSRVHIRDITPGQTVFYRVSYLDLGDLKTTSEPVGGRFKVPPAAGGGVSFVWSGDTVGQGYGINPDLGGMTIYESMRRLQPDFFVHSGDTIYADDPLQPEKKLPDGKVWKNIVTEAKSKVAETLDEYRGNYRYNLLDENLRRFNAEVPTLAQWDDHDVLNNWYWQKRLEPDPRYHEKSVARLAAYGERAFREYMPLSSGLDDPMILYRRFSFGPRLDVFRVDMRSFRGPNGDNRQSVMGPDTEFLGKTQVEWLKGSLKTSRATWKIIQADMPLGSWSMTTSAPRPARRRWPTATTARRSAASSRSPTCSPSSSARTSATCTGSPPTCTTAPPIATIPTGRRSPTFLPFYEFVSGPLCAGGFGPNPLDKTFGPEVVFQKVPPTGRFDLAPSEGSCHFGHIKIDGRTGAMTVSHHDAMGGVLHALNLAPA